ncbi:hypothetical protein C2857_003632 [Epichloe festucae Fl1]|uniref:Uncharacterized protein n=1 Tax=Epichloe festucae (strain Fl1) TaxID=877507 RepID=A0A7U3Q212_EPIFF|nr:hypothetical protein C2857_003632 [Epichloe festucae Fl1]
MAITPNLKYLQSVFAISRTRTNRITPPKFSQRMVHSKGGKSGEEGQFKAVAASQSSHEPSQENPSKPPKEATNRKLKNQAQEGKTAQENGDVKNTYPKNRL